MDGTTLNPGDPPFGLAHFTFTADPGIAPGLIPLTLIDYQAGTSLSSADGTHLDFTIVNSQINNTGSAVPELPSIVMAATSLLASLALSRRSRVVGQIACRCVELALTHHLLCRGAPQHRRAEIPVWCVDDAASCQSRYNASSPCDMLAPHADLSPFHRARGHVLLHGRDRRAKAVPGRSSRSAIR
jgi:hypothetical protein